MRTKYGKRFQGVCEPIKGGTAQPFISNFRTNIYGYTNRTFCVNTPNGLQTYFCREQLHHFCSAGDLEHFSFYNGKVRTPAVARRILNAMHYFENLRGWTKEPTKVYVVEGMPLVYIRPNPIWCTNETYANIMTALVKTVGRKTAVLSDVGGRSRKVEFLLHILSNKYFNSTRPAIGRFLFGGVVAGTRGCSRHDRLVERYQGDPEEAMRDFRYQKEDEPGRRLHPKEREAIIGWVGKRASQNYVDRKLQEAAA